MGPPKSKYGRREVPIGHDLVTALRAAHKATEWHEDTDPVFPGHTGGVLGYDNTLRRALRPTAEEAGVPWVGFHSFRHTAATRLFAAGRNAVQVQRWLGHHSPAFTLSLYVHLLDGDLGEPVDLPRQRDFSRCQCDIRTCRGVVEDGMVAEHRKADL